MLNIRELNFAFQHLSLFDKLSFDLRPAEILHLTGPNGCGKSTLLSLIAGLRNGFEGEIAFTVDGRRVADRRRCVSYLAAESNGLYGRMSASDNLKFWSTLDGKPLDKFALKLCLERWGFSQPWLAKFPAMRFSTGMKRRLGLARVELTRRPCLLLDEPLNGLDKQGIAIFRTMLEHHQARQGATLIVSHTSHGICDLVTKEVNLS